MFTKLLALVVSGLLGLSFAAFPPPRPEDGPPHGPDPKGKAKEKEKAKGKEAGPAGDLRKAYDLLRRVRAEDRPSGRPEARLRDWAERAESLYRKGVREFDGGDRRLAHEYGAAAHDLARAIDHARNASRFEEPAGDLPSPPSGPGPEGDPAAHARRELRRAHERVTEMDPKAPEGEFYRDAAADLYNAALRDAGAGRNERAAELARAAEALTHVTEHLAHAARRGPESRDDRPEPRRPAEPKPGHGPADDLPPPISTGARR